jgi:magnesium-transporting ATPase (P-type)
MMVKMLTGDNTAIAAEISEQVDLGTNIVPATHLLSQDSDQQLSPTQLDRIEAVDGFGEVFPEHKYAIVKALQSRSHLVGMTGGGVNDAELEALKVRRNEVEVGEPVGRKSRGPHATQSVDQSPSVRV